MPGGVDLHTHTTASDGTYAPRDLVIEAASRGVRVLAITDHDSTEGLPEAFEEAERRRPLELLPGIEINCDVEGAEIHVLGYLMDWQAPWFQEFCREQRRERRERVHRMAERMASLSYEDMLDKKVAFGTAKGVVERLRSLRDELGLDGIVAELNPGGRIPPELETRSLELLARDVVPALK